MGDRAFSPRFPHTIAIAVIALFVFSCSGKPGREGKVLARVNDAPILLSEFQKEVAIASERDPMLAVSGRELEDMLDGMIERRLMIEEAQKKGLSKDERFLETIKAYWEQTLIRGLIDAKTREWEDSLIVTDGEVRAYYESMGQRLRLMYVKAETEHEAEDALEALREGRGAKAWKGETVDVSAGNIGPESPLRHAFVMKEGEARLVNEDGTYIALKVLKKENGTLPPLNGVYGQIKQMLLEKKRQEAMRDWLKKIKAEARVAIDRDLLKGLVKVRDDR
jgi:hypothetical protein